MKSGEEGTPDKKWLAGETCFVTMEKNWLKFQFRQDNNITGEIVLQAGYELVAGKFFRHDIPTEGETDYAINYIEDELMSRYELRNNKEDLYSSDKNIIDILCKNGLHDNSCSRQDIEDLFSRYAHVVMGGPESGLPVDITPNDYTTILILREIMHHLNFRTLHLMIM